MEMNTRLQVEHPVTEEITGQDLVDWQLRVASGEPLPKNQEELRINGHAIEARLYAEDPARAFLPSIGRLEHLDLGDDGRIDTGVQEGDAVSAFYDPMIAKLVGQGSNRDEAIVELAAILDQLEIWPVRTNAGFLFNAVLDDDFGSARIDTGFIGRKIESLVPDAEPDEAIWRGAARMALARAEEDAFASLDGFRLNAPAASQVSLGRGGKFNWISTEGGDCAAVSGFRDEERVVAFYEGQAYEFSLAARGSINGGSASGSVPAPMPGKITAVDVAPGDKVTKGQRLLTMEAMKMEHALTAPFNGVVAELNVSAGDQVQVDAVLARIEAVEQPST
jgi:3-methylcrotonyl-CoA carboxylase alpha subunit